MKTTHDPITPAIGASVRFFPAAAGDADIGPFQVGEIVHLWSDTCANIQFTLPDHSVVIRSSVPLFQQGVDHGCTGYYGELIPLQATGSAQVQAETVGGQLKDDGPRITRQDVEAAIRSEYYFTASAGIVGDFEQNPNQDPTEAEFEALDMVTICAMILKNGTRIIGVNEGPVSPENFDPALGKTYARAKAIEQIWPLLGFELRSAIQSEVVLGTELRATDTTTDLRDVVSAMTRRPDAVQHTENPDHGFDDDAIGDRSDGVGEGPTGEIG